jgi:hypothetical protein
MLVMCGFIANDPPRRRWKTPKDVPVQVDFDARITSELLIVRYTVKNRTSAPILVFDQMPDDTPGNGYDQTVTDPSWAYVDVIRDGWTLRGRRRRVVLSRRQSEQGSMPCFSAQVPFARPLGAGMTLSGEFHLLLPLHPRGAGDVVGRYSGDDAPLESGDIEDVELRVGWADKVPVLADEEKKQVELSLPDGEVVWHLIYDSYMWVQETQQIASSTIRPVRRGSDDSR